MDVCVCHIFHFRMVYVIGASSLRRAIDKAPTSIRKSIQGKVFAVLGLSFHPTAKNPNKQLQNLLKNGLKSCKKIVIWHDLVNNSLSSHRSIGNRNCSPDVFIKILEPFREQITAIIYNQRIGTPNIHKKLVEASYITFNPKQHLLSNRKRRSAEFNQELWKLHPLERIELHILQIILHHQNNLHRLLRRNRSKFKKNMSQKQRKRLAKKK